MNGETRAAADQSRYAKVLAYCTYAGFAVLVVLFAVYTLGVVEAHISHERLPDLWHLPAISFLEEVGIVGGWGWIAVLHRADALMLVGIAALAFSAVPCLLAVMPLYWAAGQRMLFAICVLQTLVIAAAASGLVGGGH